MTEAAATRVAEGRTAHPPRRILITGSSGFVGGALMQRLVALGHTVSGVSRTPRPDTIVADITDRAAIRAAIDGFAPDLIFHLAAATDLKGPRGDYSANVEGVAAMVDAVAASLTFQRVVWASSQLVNRAGVQPADDTAMEPDTPYGHSKASGERIVRGRDGSGKPWVIARLTTIWGPGMSDHYAGVLRLIERGRYFHIGRGPRPKSYSYIDNTVSQLIALGFAPDADIAGRTFYLADAPPIDLIGWYDAFARGLDRTIPTLPEGIARMLGHVGDGLAAVGLPAPLTSARVANILNPYTYDVRAITDLTDRMGLSPVPEADGIAATLDWYRSLSR